jgi:hypothetical protein
MKMPTEIAGVDIAAEPALVHKLIWNAVVDH